MSTLTADLDAQTAATDYERDFYAWAMKNAALLRQRRFDQIDVEHIAEELEGVGRSEKRALASRLTVLLMHLLKWRFQPVHHSPSWRNTIRVQRIQVSRLLRENPSLQPLLRGQIVDAYTVARLLASNETGLDAAAFPESCPFGPEQILDENYWPD